MTSLADWELVVLLSIAAGITIPAGGLFARVEHISPKWLEKEFRHSVIAFGGGALLAAVSLVLVPQGVETSPPVLSVALFLLGGVVFYGLDRLIQSRGGSYSQLIAMVSDFMPEAMALGAMLTQDYKSALLLAFLIGLQNFPEGFNAYREILCKGHHGGQKILLWFSALVLIGPVCALLGLEYLAHMPVVMGGIMMFAAGGILYLVFQDIAPEARLKHRWAPPLGAVFGFGLGLIGHLLL
ncbi:MAG: divalent cation transporter [Methylocystaceae bacterium]|nr:divalent cation transporter [Methylocystaceae bacterium]